MLCAIWYHFKKHEEVKLHAAVSLVKLRAAICNFTKRMHHAHGFFSCFLICTCKIPSTVSSFSTLAYAENDQAFVKIFKKYFEGKQTPEMYLEPCQTSEIRCFGKIDHVYRYCKTLHLRCLTRFWIRLCSQNEIGKRVEVQIKLCQILFCYTKSLKFIWYLHDYIKTWQFSFKAGLEFTAGVPDVASVTKSISVSASYSHTWGKVEKKSVSWTQSFECAAKPGTKVVCEIFVIKVRRRILIHFFCCSLQLTVLYTW